MFNPTQKKTYHVEILPPKQETEKLEYDLEMFTAKYNRVMQSGYCACITDNAMGHLAFQGTELIEVLDLIVSPEQIMIHLNTFHTIEDLNNILNACKKKGIRYLLIVSGDGSDRLPKLRGIDLGYPDVLAVTSVTLLNYISKMYPDTFTLGVAFNPYEPPTHEFSKLEKKIDAGASFIITQPIIGENEVVKDLLATYCEFPIIIEAWMSKKLYLLSEAIGYEIPEDTVFDPLATLTSLHKIYPTCGVYLSLLGFKTQYDQLEDPWQCA